MRIIKIGECYLNLDNVTHVQFETASGGMMCTAYLTCQVTDRNGCNGIQSCKTFTASAAKELKDWLEKNMADKIQDAL